MNFHEAVDLMKMGVKVTRTSWNKPEATVSFKDDLFFKNLEGRRFTIVFFSDDVLADDWEAAR